MTKNNKENSPEGAKALIELIAKKIPDPIVIFIWFLGFAFLLTAFIGGLSFETLSADGTAINTTRRM